MMAWARTPYDDVRTLQDDVGHHHIVNKAGDEDKVVDGLARPGHPTMTSETTR